jgi:hypothetical protein
MDAEGELDDRGTPSVSPKRRSYLNVLGSPPACSMQRKRRALPMMPRWAGGTGLVCALSAAKSFAMSSVLALVSPKKFCVWPRRPNNVNRSVAKHCRAFLRMSGRHAWPITHHDR